MCVQGWKDNKIGKLNLRERWCPVSLYNSILFCLWQQLSIWAALNRIPILNKKKKNSKKNILSAKHGSFFIWPFMDAQQQHPHKVDGHCEELLSDQRPWTVAWGNTAPFDTPFLGLWDISSIFFLLVKKSLRCSQRIEGTFSNQL